MNKYNKLISNSIIFIIGNFGSKLINLLMVPLYTNYLSTVEYGSADLILTTRNMLLPFLTMELGQAAVRYTIGDSSKLEKESIFSNLVGHSTIISIILVLFYPVLSLLNVGIDNLGLLIILLILSVMNNYLSLYMRGIGLVKQFAFNGIITTIVTVISNILLLIVFDFGLDGYLFSILLATFISNIYLLICISKRINIFNFNYNRSLLKEMLTFSVPIIPTSAIWWIINGSTRYFILFFLNTSANGIFAVANKIPSIISLLSGIFFQAWQLSSFEEYESEDKDIFYSNIFNLFSTLMFLVGGGLLIVIKPIFAIFVGADYYSSWEVAPLLILAVIFQGFSSFLGTNYTSAMKTKGSLTTSIYGGIISIISSFLFIPWFGLIGAGISSLLSFLGVFIIRFIDTRKFVKISLKTSVFTLNILIYCLQTLLLFMMNGLVLIIFEMILYILMIVINWIFLKPIMLKIWMTIKKKIF